MRRLFSLSFFLSFTTFLSFGQTDLGTIDYQHLTVRGCTPRVSYIQATQKVDNIGIVSESEQQNSGSLDITDPEMANLSARPNPSKGPISIEVPASLIGFEIHVYDMSGRRVGNPVPITATTENMTLEGESGIYLIVIRTEKHVYTERILLDTY